MIIEICTVTRTLVRMLSYIACITLATNVSKCYNLEIIELKRFGEIVDENGKRFSHESLATDSFTLLDDWNDVKFNQRVLTSLARFLALTIQQQGTLSNRQANPIFDFLAKEPSKLMSTISNVWDQMNTSKTLDFPTNNNFSNHTQRSVSVSVNPYIIYANNSILETDFEEMIFGTSYFLDLFKTKNICGSYQAVTSLWKNERCSSLINSGNSDIFQNQKSLEMRNCYHLCLLLKQDVELRKASKNTAMTKYSSVQRYSHDFNCDIHMPCRDDPLVFSTYISSKNSCKDIFYLHLKETLEIYSNDCSEVHNADATNYSFKNTTLDGFEFHYIDSDVPVKFVILSIWHWWKELITIGVISLFLLNLIVKPRREIIVIERHIPILRSVDVPRISCISLTNDVISKKKGNIFEENRGKSISRKKENFLSRFQEDFEFIRCLGRGGFGVVFQAKNKLDDCTYAVKRIALPRCNKSRLRVMREVKTLASCEHQNIVRYFQAWVETPPTGYQEERDKIWLFKESLDTNKTIESSKDNKSMNTHEKQYLENSRCRSPINIRGSIAEDFQKINVKSTISSDSFEIEFVNSDGNVVENDAFFHNSKHGSGINISHLDSVLTNSSKALLPLSFSNRMKSKRIFLYIQMELCKKESLRDWLYHNNVKDRQPYITSIFQQILDAVHYVHFKGLIHRDLKPSNIFFSLNGQIKIGDFGLVTGMSDQKELDMKTDENTDFHSWWHTQKVGTYLYMSPEQLNGQNYNFKVDIYSLGLIFFELLVFFNTEMERILTLRNLRKAMFPSNFASEYPLQYKVVKRMLSPSPEKRPSTDELKTKFSSITDPKSTISISHNVKCI